MLETYTYSVGHDPLVGWIVIGGSLLFAIVGWKRRAFFAPGLGIAGAVVYLIAGFDGRYSQLLFAPMLLGIFIDSHRSKEWAAMKKPMQIALSLLWPALIAWYIWWAIGDRPFQITVRETELVFTPARDAFPPYFDRETILKSDLTATRLRVKNSHRAQWRFRSGTDPNTMISVDAVDTFRDQDGRRWTGEELAQHIVQWAGVGYKVKFVRDFIEEMQFPELDLEDVPVPKEDEKVGPPIVPQPRR